MKKTLLILMILLSAHSFASDINSKLTLVPTFENCSFYYDYDTALSLDKAWNTSEVFKLFIQKEGTEVWQEVFNPFYDSSINQFRGSIFNLSENTSYKVKVEIFQNNAWTSMGETLFNTWSSTPPLRSTILVSNLAAYQQGKGIELKNMKGSESGWFKVVGNVPINAGTTADNAILIDNCENLILENFTVTGGRLNGIKINDNCKNIRIVGADISAWGRIPVDQVYLDDAANYPLSKYKDYDAVYLDENKELIRNDAGINMETTDNSTRPHSNFVVERCYIHDPNGYCNAWYGKRTLGTGAGTDFRFLHPQGPQGIYIRSSGGLVVRYNDIVGSDRNRLHDLSGGKDNGKMPGGYYRDADIYGNYLAFAQDDGIELDGGQRNVRFYNNRIEQVRCGVSIAPNLSGPSYLIGNVIHHLGDSERENGAAIKSGGGTTYSLGQTFFINNTMYVNASCIAGVGYGSEDNKAMFQGYSRNNILYSTVPNNSYGGNAIHELYSHQNNSFDYDLLANSTRPNTQGVAYVKTPDSELNAVKGDPLFTDLDHRVFTIQNNSPGIGRGQKQNNISTNAEGINPDMGAFALGESSLYPKRPMEVEADKYFVKINPKDAAYINISIGNIAEGITCSVTKNADMDWLTVDHTSQSVTSNSNFSVKISTDAATDKLTMGAVYVRFSNGLSIPVSIVSDPSTPVSVEEVLDSKPHLFIYKDRHINAQLTQNGTLEIHDITGKFIAKTICTEGYFSMPFDTQRGFYILSFYPSYGDRSAQKLFVN